MDWEGEMEEDLRNRAVAGSIVGYRSFTLSRSVRLEVVPFGRYRDLNV